jgi:hypothetical protein
VNNNAGLLLQVPFDFHGVDYLVTVSVLAGTISLAIEQKSDASCWKGDFTARCKWL